MDALILSRIQFSLTSMFHYIYPPLSIGLGLYLVMIEGIYMRKKDPIYLQMTKFWVKIFALTFALGVATGLVQVFGFGTNWGNYSRFVGDVFGSALGAEGIFAFFLEAGFLGVMLFGWNKVSAKIHYLSTILVCLGAHFSAVWIVIANSWMQTPRGFRIEGTGEKARAVVTNFWEMIFNPSSLDRLTHVLIGCWLTGLFLVISINAYYLLKKRYVELARKSIKTAFLLACAALILQLISADSTATGVGQNQPSKMAAMEGVFETKAYTPMHILGWVDKESKEVKGLHVPGLLSFLMHRNFKTPVTGLDQIPADEHPPLQTTFQAYHLMIYMWGLMVLGAFTGFILFKTDRLERHKWFLKFLIISVAFPQIANMSGWMTAEVGRQPWVVWKLLRTQHGLSPNISTVQVLSSLIMLAVIYTGLLAVFLFLLDKKIKHGPFEEKENEPLFHKIEEGL